MADNSRRVPYVTGSILILLGLALLGGGAWLIALGGSFYYAIAGLGFVATGGLLFAGRAAALWVFAAVVAGTLAWALDEVGLDWWPLAARGGVVVIVAVWLSMPWIVRRLGSGGWGQAAPLLASVAASAVVLVLSLGSTHHDIAGTLAMGAPGAHESGADDGSAMPAGDWQAYGRTQAGQRYSPLDAITPQNARNLVKAWEFRTGDLPRAGDPVETTFEVTPIKAGNSVFLCSQHQRVFALDAVSGKLIWKYDPQVKDNGTFQHLTCRGVTYFAEPTASSECTRRIFLGTNDARLIALDADSGVPCSMFGQGGTVNLQTGMPVTTLGQYEVTSPPVVTDRLVIVNGSVTDNYSTHEPSGVIRAFDANTGALVWAWDAGNPDENAMPSAGHDYTENSPNSWMTMSYDPKLGLLYVPMGVQTPDIWGGHRTPVAERYSSALVALDARTGRRVWDYQTVHHDLWDMDLPSQPTLVDLPGPGGAGNGNGGAIGSAGDGSAGSGSIPALVQPTKSGNLFVLDRRNGHLIVPAPEQAVPQGAAPGDRTSPTQPFSALTFRPSALLTEADMWGGTMFDQLACRILFRQLRYDGTFTPPSLQGTLVFPGNLGMFEWGGVAVDPVRGIAIANPIEMPFVSQLLPRGPDNPAAPNAKHPPGSEIGVQPMYGTPYGVKLGPFLSPIGLPCLRPPWGSMAAVDLKTDKIIWMHRNGTIRDSAPLPIPIKMGVPSLGGPIVTAGGVAFLTSTTDYFIRAYDVKDGTQLWESRLPAGAQSTPMSYSVAGRQFVVTAAGGHGSFGTKAGDYVIAYALKE